MAPQDALALPLPFRAWHKAPGRQRASAVICDELGHGGRYARIRCSWLGMAKWTDVEHLTLAEPSERP